MNPIEFEGQDGLLGPPPGTPRGTCGKLPVKRVNDGVFGGYFVSYWKPTPEELAQLNAGAHVALAVHQGAHPPVWIDVEKAKELP